MLLEAQAVDQGTRDRAGEALGQMKDTALQALLGELALILSDEAAPKNARLLAALTLKNTVKQSSSPSASLPSWLLLDPPSQLQIRKCTLSTLASPDKDVRNAAAQAVSALASLDLPRKQWPDILDILVRNAGSKEVRFKLASIVTLGLICEELGREGLDKRQSDLILTAIAANLSAPSPDPELHLNSLHALSNALKFARPNFESPRERHYLVSLLCSASEAGEDRTRALALQVLCDVGIVYYALIADDLKEIWTVTSAAMTHGSEPLAILATEFWTCLGDAEKEGQQTRYLPQAAPALVPLLLANTLKYRASDEDEWTLRKSAATLLALLAGLVGGQVVEEGMAFAHANITADDWRRRNSGAMVFGAMLEGPREGRMEEWVVGGGEAMLALLNDESVTVRQTAVWVLGRICDLYFPVISSSPVLQSMIPGLVRSLKDQTKVAVYGCWAFISLFDKGEGVISPSVTEEVMAGLLEVTRKPVPREDSIELHIAAFSALCSLIEKSSAGSQPLLKRHLPVLLSLLKGSLRTSGADTLQAFICSALQAICVKLPKSALKDEADRLVSGIVELFLARQGVVEEGIQALGALAQTLDLSFTPYVPTLGPFLVWALSQHTASSVCKSATLVVGDLARALGPRIDPYVSELVPLILRNLEREEVDSDVKVQSIAALADLASNAESQFCAYLADVLRLIDQAADATCGPVPPTNPDLFDYFIELREAILQFYVGLFQTVFRHFPSPSLVDCVPKVVDFALYSTQEALHPTEDMQINALGLLGDISVSCGESVRSVVTKRGVLKFLEKGKSGGDKVREMAMWAENTIVGNC